jgi:EKC/KEOPS complex subunit PCC1/LAGE3
MIDDYSSGSESDLEVESEKCVKKIRVDDPSELLTESTVQAEYRIAFDSPSHAQIARNSLQVDREPKRGQTTKTLDTEDNLLTIHLQSSDVRNLRTASNSLLDFVSLVQDTIRRFGANS